MVETEHTPNPDTLKFLPGKKVSEVGPIEFLKEDKNIKVPLANKILSLEGTLMVVPGPGLAMASRNPQLHARSHQNLGTVPGLEFGMSSLLPM